MRCAIVDIGTNTMLLLIADVDSKGRVTPICHEQRIPRLGRDVDRSGLLQSEAIERSIPVLQDYQQRAKELNAECFVACATSAVRDALNRSDFLDRVQKTCGVHVEVLSGEDEAMWTYRGAVSGLPHSARKRAVIDIGGGSTEFSFPPPDAVNGDKRLHRYSFELGCVRLTERYYKHSPPFSTEIQSAAQFIAEEFSQVRNPGFGNYELVGVAGTATTLACLNLKLEEFELEKVSGHRLEQSDVSRWSARLHTMTPAQVASLSRATEGRADILACGALILNETMGHFGFTSVTVSERGLRYGLALREWEHPTRHT